MKKMILLTNALLLLIAFITMACYPPKGLMSLIHPISNEDTIELSQDIIPINRAAYYFSLDTDIKVPNTANNLVSIDTLAVKLYIKDIYTLYYTAKRLYSGNGKYITALQINYGFNTATHAITLYFRPLCLYRISTCPSGDTGIYALTTSPPSYSNSFFTYSEDNVFGVASYTELQDTSNYMTNVKLRHHLIDPPTPFNQPTVNGVGDPKAVIYPFQEIFALVADNMPDKDYIKISNIGIKIRIKGTPSLPPDSLLKHDLLIGPPKLLPTGHILSFIGAPGFYKLYADLNHLCPPDCIFGSCVGCIESIKYPLGTK